MGENMEKQMIISISREYGSGGHGVANKLGELLGLPVYDKNIMFEIAQEKGVDMSEWDDHEEKPGNRLLYRRVGNYSSNPSDIIHEMEFDFIKEKAASGKSFIVLGRCSDYILRDYEGLIKIFIRGDMEDKILRLMKRLDESREEAIADINKIDRLRRKYHNKHADTKWGDSRHYDLCINTHIGVEETAHIIESFVRKYMELDA